MITGQDREGKNRGKRNLILVIGCAVAVIAVAGLIYTIIEYGKSDRIYEKAAEEFVVILPEENDEADSNGNHSIKGEKDSVVPDSPEGEKDTAKTAKSDENNKREISEKEALPADGREWYQLASVDLERLTAAYPDVVGWIYFENEKISYPIVYSGDNTTYLRTAYTGKSATAGSIFLDGESTPDFSDPHTLIYGHNMRNLSMFGRLGSYLTEKGYYDDHRYFQIFLDGRVYRYEIFAYGEIPANSSVYEAYGQTPGQAQMRDLLNVLEKLGADGADVEAGPSDHLLTLSTCTKDGDVRVIVSAVRVDEHAYG